MAGSTSIVELAAQLGWVARAEPYRADETLPGGAEPDPLGYGSLMFRAPLWKASDPPPPSEFNPAWPPTEHLTPLDQGSQALCVAHAACASVEGRIERMGGIPARLAPRQLHFCIIGNSGSNGASVAQLHGALKARGAPIDHGDDSAIRLISDCALIGQPGRAVKVAGLHMLDSPMAMKAAIAMRGPIVGYMDQYPDFWNHYVDGIYRPTVSWPASAPPPTHAVSVIGYSDHQGFWVCRNSRGTAWGQFGYFLIAYDVCRIGLGLSAYELILQ